MRDAPARVLLVGAGVTSSIVARLLHGAAPQLEVHVWEKARGVGGRMSVARSDATGGRADMGAQYVTEVDGVAGAHRALYAELERAGVLLPMRASISGTRGADGGGQNWVAPAGLNAVAKALLRASGARVSLGRGVAAVERVVVARADGATAAKWRVSRVPRAARAPPAADADAADDAEDDIFDAVVLTMPVPQVLELGGAVADGLRERPDLLDRLRAVEYSARYALALFWAREDDAARSFVDRLPWDCRYVPKEEESAIVFVSRCAHKRRAATNDGGDANARDTAVEPPSFVVHSSVPFALAKLRDGADTAVVGTELLERVRALLPGLPPPADSRTQLWRFSQVRVPIHAERAAHALSADGEPPLLIAGDAFSAHGSRFDGCYESARDAAEQLLAQLGLDAARPGAPPSAL